MQIYKNNTPVTSGQSEISDHLLSNHVIDEKQAFIMRLSPIFVERIQESTSHDFTTDLETLFEFVNYEGEGSHIPLSKMIESVESWEAVLRSNHSSKAEKPLNEYISLKEWHARFKELWVIEEEFEAKYTQFLNEHGTASTRLYEILANEFNLPYYDDATFSKIHHWVIWNRETFPKEFDAIFNTPDGTNKSIEERQTDYVELLHESGKLIEFAQKYFPM